MTLIKHFSNEGAYGSKHFWKIDFNVVEEKCTYFDAMTSPRYIIYGHEIVRWNFYGTIFACFAYVRARLSLTSSLAEEG